MKPDRYEASTQGRHRLSGMIQKRGSKTGFSNAGIFLFGIPFVGIGTFVTLIGTKIVPVDPSTVHAPYWVLTVFGLCFFLAGLSLWVMGAKQVAANRRRLAALRQYSANPVLANAMADYQWHPKGFEVSEWSGAAKAIAGALGLTLFLSIFNALVFGPREPLFAKIIIGIFDCIALWAWSYTIMLIGRAFKFGKSRILYSPFPYQLSDPVTIHWQPEGEINQIRKGTFTLRCVEEWMEQRARGNDEHPSVVHEEIWSATWNLETPRNLPLKEAIELVYELPADAVPTQLNADKPIFWELAVHLDLPGLDFKATYLVPIYDSKRPSGKPAALHS